MTTIDIKYSIVMPCYNASAFLERAIESALKQSTCDYEIIVVDDGSTDATYEILHSYLTENEGRISCIRQHNMGPGAARNVGISAARGKYVLFLDTDDELVPDALQIFETALGEDDSKCDFVFAGHYSVDPDGKMKQLSPEVRAIERHNDFKRLLEGKSVSPTPGAIIVRKGCFQNLSYPETIRCNEDFVLFAHLFALYAGRSISQPVVYKYKRKGSLRYDKQAIIDAIGKAPDLLFDPSVLPSEYFKYKPLYVAKRYLEKARIHFKNKEFSDFRATFHQAVGVYPGSIIKHRFLIRYIYSLVYQAFHHG